MSRQRSTKLFVGVALGIALTLGGVVAGGVWFVRDRAERTEQERTKRYPGRLGPDRVCLMPLSSYCGRTEKCRTPEAETARQLEDGSRGEVTVGTCGALTWVKGVAWFGGTTSYFDSKGTLVAVDSWSDALTTCTGRDDERSWRWLYGPVPSCHHETKQILKQLPAWRAQP